MNYATIPRELWEDPSFGDLTPEEKFFAIWTISAPQVRKCGCWPLNARLAAAETGFNSETIQKLVVRLQEAGWLLYEAGTREVLICDWGRRNAGLFRSSEVGKKGNSARSAIIREAEAIKCAAFRKAVEEWLGLPLHDPSTPRLPPVDGGSTYSTCTYSTLLNDNDTFTGSLDVALAENGEQLPDYIQRLVRFAAGG